MSRYWWLAVVVLSSAASSANAFCWYGGVLYAKTTLAQEFRDSGIVIEGTVLSSREIVVADDDPKPAAEPGVLYRIEVNHAFKGNPSRFIQDFSERDSGGFYLDTGTRYLLFLNRMSHTDWARRVAPDTYRVNYNCGQSRPWGLVPASDRSRLTDWSGRAR